MLCVVCLDLFRAHQRRSIELGIEVRHHADYSSLRDSAARGCAICIPLHDCVLSQERGTGFRGSDCRFRALEDVVTTEYRDPVGRYDAYSTFSSSKNHWEMTCSARNGGDILTWKMDVFDGMYDEPCSVQVPRIRRFMLYSQVY